MNRAIRVRETGGAEKLLWETAEVGDPGEEQVRVALRAAGVNFIDVYFRSGAIPQAHTIHSRSRGGRSRAGSRTGVTMFAEGDRVAWSTVPGSYAESVIAPVSALIRVPDGVSEELAAAAMLQGMTAHYLSTSTHPVKSGEHVLVHAAAGGVGPLLIQMLKRAGALVIGTCSTAEKEEIARSAGADDVIRYDECDFADRVAEITNGAGCDVVYDSVGRSTFEGSLRSLKPRGLLALFGQSSGAVPPFDLQQLNQLGSLFVTRPSLAHYTASREEFELRAGAVLGAVGRGELEIRIGARFPLEKAADAHRALEGRKTTGKVLLEC